MLASFWSFSMNTRSGGGLSQSFGGERPHTELRGKITLYPDVKFKRIVKMG
jgi:hypothetical protein